MTFGCALALACGASPANMAGQPSGSLIVTIRQGPDLVPFKPMVARTYRANAQITSILGHSILIEIDGALMPQSEEGAADVVARIVEEVARDLDALKNEDPRSIEFARASFERLVVRYAPAEAAARESRRRGHAEAKLDPAKKTVDVVRGEASWFALESGEIARVLGRAFATGLDDRYADVLPDTLPRGERRAWFEYHRRGMGRAAKTPKVGSVDPQRVRGMVMLYGLSQRDQDEALARDARKWLVDEADAFAQTYHHHAAEVEAASSGSPYRQAESMWIAWVNAELPKMTLDERGKLAQHLWVVDFRRESGERDRYAKYAFPGIDVMAFSLQAIDAWSAAGAPATREQNVHPYFEHVVCPAVLETKTGHASYNTPGRCDGDFYRWAVADRARMDAFVRAMTERLKQARTDALAITVFKSAHRALRAENEYLDFLGRFEATPNAWRVGADIQREVAFRPSERLLDDARRHWREVDTARGDALFWFARHIDGSYHPDSDWPDLLQGRLADERILGAYLDLGWDAFQLLPVAWPALAKNGARLRVITGRAGAFYDQDIRPQPGHRGISSTLAAVGTLLCEERAFAEASELNTWAKNELVKRPGAGLSDVVDATEPSKCAQTKAHETPRTPPKPKPKPARDPNLFPPKQDER